MWFLKVFLLYNFWYNFWGCIWQNVHMSPAAQSLPAPGLACTATTGPAARQTLATIGAQTRGSSHHQLYTLYNQLCASPPPNLQSKLHPLPLTESLTLLFNCPVRFGNVGCAGLCRGLKGNRTLLRLSLNYCDLGPDSGEVLGQTVSNTAIRCEKFQVPSKTYKEENRDEYTVDAVSKLYIYHNRYCKSIIQMTYTLHPHHYPWFFSLHPLPFTAFTWNSGLHSVQVGSCRCGVRLLQSWCMLYRVLWLAEPQVDLFPAGTCIWMATCSAVRASSSWSSFLLTLRKWRLSSGLKRLCRLQRSLVPTPWQFRQFPRRCPPCPGPHRRCQWKARREGMAHEVGGTFHVSYFSRQCENILLVTY